jgi:hypothetical protein
MVVEILSDGLIFGADRNITTTLTDGSTAQNTREAKVLRWPNNDILFGFVGAARINNMSVAAWLESIRGKFRKIDGLENIANELRDLVQKQRGIDEGAGDPEPLIIHLGGFEKKARHWVPYVWHIRNVHNIGKFNYLDFRKDFICNEEVWNYFKDIDPSEIRQVLKVLAKQFTPFWFHQGLDLVTFNVLQTSIKEAFRHLCNSHPEHDVPTTIEEWEKHVKMQVLMYGAYYDAFYPKGNQYVGGGVDVVSLKWPI